MKGKAILMVIVSLAVFPPFSRPASEVLTETKTKVLVRENPVTGKPFVSVVASDNPEASNPFRGIKKANTRPDYRMLDPKVKSGQIPYDGPVSDRKKVYILAASLATLGAAGGIIGPAVLPATASTGSVAGGAGLYAAAGTAVSAGTVSAAWLKTRPDPQKDDYILKSGSKVMDLDQASSRNDS